MYLNGIVCVCVCVYVLGQHFQHLLYYKQTDFIVLTERYVTRIGKILFHLVPSHAAVCGKQAVGAVCNI
jgi:hypothetical protein